MENRSIHHVKNITTSYPYSQNKKSTLVNQLFYFVKQKSKTLQLIAASIQPVNLPTRVSPSISDALQYRG